MSYKPTTNGRLWKPAPAVGKRGKLRRLLRLFQTLALALVLALLIKVSILEAYRIPSESMENTLLVGDFLLANKFIYGARIPLTDLRLPSLREPRVGDVIVFRYPAQPEKNFIKRIVATEGQSVEIKSKRLFVDGQEITFEPYAIHSDPIMIPKSALQPRDNFGPITVPKNHYFVMGDNRDNSSDSRYWGTVPRELILGEATLIHWSWQADPKAPEASWRNPLSLLHLLAYNIVHLPSRVRWNRLFMTIA